MKALLNVFLFFGITITTWANGNRATDSTGNPGDNLDLQAVLDLFKSSKDLEEFEKALNSEQNQVNNLDLNKDGETDYIRVIDRVDSNAHAIVLQVSVSETESQDVAVIELEKTDDEFAGLQIVGDDDVYGNDYLYEPFEDYVGQDESSNNNNSSSTTPVKVMVNVWAWPVVRTVYAPRYRPWISPWRWRHYPAWWRPWHPVTWHVYHKKVIRYHTYCRRVYVHRVHVAHRVYHKHRVYSPTVRKTHVIHHTTPKGKTSHRGKASSTKPSPSKVQQKKATRKKQSSKGSRRSGGQHRR